MTDEKKPPRLDSSFRLPPGSRVVSVKIGDTEYHMPPEKPKTPSVRKPGERLSVKRYAEGKFFLFASAPAGHEEWIERALRDASSLEVSFDADRFRTFLAARGILPDDIERCLASVEVLNEAFGTDRDK